MRTAAAGSPPCGFRPADNSPSRRHCTPVSLLFRFAPSLYSKHSALSRESCVAAGDSRFCTRFRLCFFRKLVNCRAPVMPPHQSVQSCRSRVLATVASRTPDAPAERASAARRNNVAPVVNRSSVSTATRPDRRGASRSSSTYADAALARRPAASKVFCAPAPSDTRRTAGRHVAPRQSANPQASRSPHIRACRLQRPANRLCQRRRQPLRQPSVIPVLEPENHLLRNTFRLLRTVRDKPDRPRLPPVRYLRPCLLPLREAIRAKCRDDSAVQAPEGWQERAASRTARREEQVGQHTADRRYRAPHITPPRPPPAGGGSAPYSAWTGGYSPPSSGSQIRARPESPCAGHVSLPYTADSASEARSRRCTSA